MIPVQPESESGSRPIAGLGTVFCLAEDRAGAEIGLKLLVLSLSQHCPGSRIVLFRPASAPGFSEWLRRFPQVNLEEWSLPGANNWNCKPHALLELLPEGGVDAQVIWLDSDLVVTSDLRVLFADCGPGVIGVTQEPLSSRYQGSELRTRGWGLPVGRCHPFTFNSCVVRVTARHRGLLERWREFLGREEYTASAKQPIDLKPPHLWSDQDVLNALLGSIEFERVPVRMLAHGREVLHTGGGLAFSLSERVTALFRPVPCVLHAIGVKPWVLLNPGRREPGRFAWFRRLMQETSPYVVHVRRYRGGVGESTAWCDQRTPTGMILNALSLGHWALRGFPVTVFCTVARRWGWF